MDTACTVLTSTLQCSVTGLAMLNPLQISYASTYHQIKVLICKGMIMHTEANLNQKSHLNSGY